MTTTEPADTPAALDPSEAANPAASGTAAAAATSAAVTDPAEAPHAPAERADRADRSEPSFTEGVREELQRWKAGILTFLRNPADTLGACVDAVVHRWRTSIQTRVIGSVFASSLIVILLLGFVLIGFVSQQLLATKYTAAVEEIDRARAVVEQQIDSTDASNPASVRLTSARAVLVDRTGGVDQSAGPVYEPVLIAPGTTGPTVVPDTAVIPQGLRTFVEQGQVAYQYVTYSNEAGTFKSLVIGTPVNSDISGLELYLILPLNAEEATLALMRGLLAAGAIVLLVLLVVIAWVFSQQLTLPVRSASRIAERFAAGHLRERMVVNGQDEVAKLAESFNDMAEKLSTQIRNLEEFGSLQRQFTSDVSHELRTPLTTVRMAADLIHDNADQLDPVSARASELMNKELDRFETLLGDLLEISRHDAGVANLSSEKIDIRGIVRSSLAQVRAIAEDAGTHFTVTLPEEPVVADIDSRRIERVLRNLLANAVDHCEGNPIDIAMATAPGVVAVTVTDHGVGLKPGEVDLVFNRFWRSDPSRERRTGGTGLGLAIAKEDARLHGGRLDATGEPGVGACFRLTLPLERGATCPDSPLPLVVADITPPAESAPSAEPAVSAEGAEQALPAEPVLPAVEEDEVLIEGDASAPDEGSVLEDNDPDAVSEEELNAAFDAELDADFADFADELEPETDTDTELDAAPDTPARPSTTEEKP